MYWLSKIFQASGLVVMGWGFVKYYPALMPHHVFLISGVLFICGWIIQTYLLRK